MKQETFEQTMYVQRQKMIVVSLSRRPDYEKSMLGKVIDCYNDKSEWVLVCNANGWKC